MQFRVIEHFKDRNAKPVYERFAAKGRLMPEGVRYVASWIAADFSCCYQVMETDDAALLQQWVAGWSDLVAFDIVPVVSGVDAAKAAATGT